MLDWIGLGFGASGNDLILLLDLARLDWIGLGWLRDFGLGVWYRPRFWRFHLGLDGLDDTPRDVYTPHA